MNEGLEQIALDKIIDYTIDKNHDIRVIFLGAAFKGKPNTNDFRESFTKKFSRKTP